MGSVRRPLAVRKHSIWAQLQQEQTECRPKKSAQARRPARHTGATPASVRHLPDMIERFDRRRTRR